MILSGEISARLGMHLDMTDAGDEVDFSANGVTVDDGYSYVQWVQVVQLGSADSAHYPGLFAEATGGGWDDYATLSSTDGATYTSGTPDMHIRVEWDDGSVARCNPVPAAVGDGSWHLVGFTFASDGSIQFFIDDSAPANDYNDYTGASFMEFNYFGPGYAGATNAGKADKYADDAAIYDRQVTATEMADAYAAGTIPDSPIHHWPMDDDSDTSTIVDAVGAADGANNGCTYVKGDAAP